MPTTLSIELNDDFFETFKEFKNTEILKRRMFEDFILEQRQNGIISLGEAAKLLKISYSECLGLLGERGFALINSNEEELLQSQKQSKAIFEKLNSKN